MKKFKIGTSFLLLILLFILTKNIVVFLNYFLALFLHELAHLFVASRKGYSLRLIKLDIFGLSLDLNEKIDDGDTFSISIAGPMFNLFLCLCCTALYWLLPNSFYFLNLFCLSNLILAVFNLIPIYPLDGGKIVRAIVKNEKAYNIIDKVVRWAFAFVLLVLFIISCFSSPNWIYALFLIFLVSSSKRLPTLSIFKYKHNKNFDKVIMLKVGENDNLFSMLKKIKNHYYTIFYCPKTRLYYDEDQIITYATKYSLETKIEDVK